MKMASWSFFEPSYANFLTALVLLTSFTWRLQGGGIYSPIMDCDETFNYFEALHYLLHNSGMQTWEYAAQYGLRSWFYIWLHAIPVKTLHLLGFHLSKVQEFLLVRMYVYLISCAFEAFLCVSVKKRFGSNAAWLSVLFFGFSSGMGHARRSFLPSSTCMMAFTLAQAFWLRNEHDKALIAGSFAVLVAWPFSAIPFIPIGLHAIAERGFLRVLLIGVVCLAVFGLIPAAVDSAYYGKAAWPTLQMILYNALGSSGGGAHLYGVEDWTFYLKNLLLNFNILVPISLASVLFSDPKIRLYHGTPVMLVFLVFQFMAHKEERFLFMIYPTICWSVAAVIAPGDKAKRSIYRAATVGIVVLVFVALSVSRDLAISRLSAPAQVFDQLNSKPLKTEHSVLCLGREWHRFPSSFFIPDSMTLAWTKSDFHGILPQPFDKMNGYARNVPHMNDMNREEPTRYVPPTSCDYVIDSDEPYTGSDDLNPINEALWAQIGECLPICDLNNSKQPFRSFANPFDKWMGVTKRRYCLFQKKKQ
jgi:alpha-1,2-mannosyltransferase